MRARTRPYSVATKREAQAEAAGDQPAITVDTLRADSVEIRAFGASEVIVNGQIVKFAPAKGKWIIMLLALAGAEGRSLSKRELSRSLWPFADGNEYHVNRIIKRVLDSLGPAGERVYMPAPHTLRMNLEDVEFDVLQFRSVLHEAEQREDPGPIEAAVHLRPDRLMSDFPEDEATMEPERSKLRTQLLRTLQMVADRAKEKNDVEAEARALALTIEENPLPDEDCTRRLVEVCERTEAPEKAVWALKRFREKGGSRTASLPAVERFLVATHNRVGVVNEQRPSYEAGKQSSSEQLRAELTRAIDKEQTAGAVRRLLRQHPHLLAGSDFVHAGVVMSNVELGHKSRADLACADFAYIEPQSGRSYVHVISFADPATRIFSEREEFTPQFHRATELLEACAYWIGRNRLQLPEVFGPRYEEVAGEPLSAGFFIPKCTLVIGRRSELSSARAKEKLEARRGNESSGVAIRTYDGFLEEVEPTIRVDPTNDRGIRCVPYESD